MDSKARDSQGQPRPPQLPPRQSHSAGSHSGMDAPPPYELVAHQQRAYEKATTSSTEAPAEGLTHGDPRSSSQQSLLPEYEEQDGRRTLLLIYIHGFMGNETSFRSFPAHVHNLLCVLLADTHVVHTKIYPRYRSKGNISIARNDLSKWLEPHESSSTDVVLLGHSMGGLLSAELTLMPAPAPGSRPLKHRILGTINFDVPFLGMHPGVIKSGLSSIFKPAEETHDDKWDEVQQSMNAVNDSIGITGSGALSPPSRTDTLWEPSQNDPNFNPAFSNDVQLPVRKGWRSAWHFINKHSNDLVNSTKKLVSSHMEFGGAMANYGELKARYARVRALEEADGRVRQSVVEGGVPSRVRFVNYYTASTGRPKKPLSPNRRPSASPDENRPSSQHSRSTEGDQNAKTGEEAQGWEGAMETMKIGDGNFKDANTTSSGINSTSLSDPPPAPPPLGDLSYIQDEKIRDLVRSEHGKAVAAYEKAVRERGQSKGKGKVQEAVRTEDKEQPASTKPESEMTHSEREHLRLGKEKQRMEAEARRMRGEKEPEITPTESASRPVVASRAESTMSGTTLQSTTAQETNSLAPEDSKKENDPAKPRKDRKFCNLPPKDSNGELDPCWVRVFMENVDEVGAHCGLFFVDERYERLVGDVAERIELWVNEDLGSRTSRAMELEKS